MCGIVKLLHSDPFEIYCYYEPHHRHPWPPIDLERIKFPSDPETYEPGIFWKGQLSAILNVIVAAGGLENPEFANNLGTMAADIGNRIAGDAGADISLEWSAH